MRIKGFRVIGIRCFDDTGVIELSPGCNIFIGQNNTGKSTLLKSLLAFQRFPFNSAIDLRKGSPNSNLQILVSDLQPNDHLEQRTAGVERYQFVQNLSGPGPISGVPGFHQVNANSQLFGNVRPYHSLIPFLARRKASAFEQDISEPTQAKVTGTLTNLYSRVDLLATAGHPRHKEYMEAVNEIIGLEITTRAASSGKQAGVYLDDHTFITLDQLGDGVTEMLALIVELCLERNKVFILEEPETNLHPTALRALLALVRRAVEKNQFVIATHSNIVVRELGCEATAKVFNVYREAPQPHAASGLQEIGHDASARREVLRGLGYEFADMDLHEAWLFMEESSAERVVNDILVPFFVPELKGRLRTFAAGGISKLEPSIAEFQRLITYIHLQPAYEKRLWVIADGDDAGRTTIAEVRRRFSYLNDETCQTFKQPYFENYYPAPFGEKARAALAVRDKQGRRTAKAELLREVVAWSVSGNAAALSAWEESAGEPIGLLRSIAKHISP